MHGNSIGSLILIALSFVLGACSVFGGKAAPEPSHRVVLKDEGIEVREYEGHAIAWTTVPGAFDEAVGTGFRRLFKYITGSNLRETDIEMTAPVLTEPRRARVGATVKLELRRSAEETGPSSLAGPGIGGWSTGFILPPGYTKETAPPPANTNIVILDVERVCVASIRFGGKLDDEAAEKARQELQRWIAARGLDHSGDWKAAGYHPPWTIPAFRRNEVLVTLRSC